jgi:regulator of sigma E protease
MSIINILLTLLIFSVLVLVHEAGHFTVAKMCGIYVEEFSIGMGPLIYSKTVGETMYSIRAVPMGGFCRMLGEDEDNKDNRAFNNKSVPARMAVIFTGPLMNFVFAFIAVFIVCITSSSIVQPYVTEVLANSNAAKQGLETGDKILKIGNESINTYQDLYLALDGCTGENLNVVVKRNDEKIHLKITPIKDDSQSRWIIGFRPLVKSGYFSGHVEGYEKVTMGEIVHESFFTMIFYVKSVVIGFVRLFSLSLSPDDVAGPIGIVQVVGQTVSSEMQYSLSAVVRSLLTISALLSANLGAINLFPIPAMDGGRLAFLIVEGLRGKPIDRNKEGFVHFIGFVLLVIFMLLVASNDILRIFKGR